MKLADYEGKTIRDIVRVDMGEVHIFFVDASPLVFRDDCCELKVFGEEEVVVRQKQQVELS